MINRRPDCQVSPLKMIVLSFRRTEKKEIHIVLSVADDGRFLAGMDLRFKKNHRRRKCTTRKEDLSEKSRMEMSFGEKKKKLATLSMKEKQNTEDLTRKTKRRLRREG